MFSLVCVGLLTAQLTGLHMHVNVHGYAGVPVGTHVHRTDMQADESARIAHTEEANRDHHRGDSEHDGDRDVSVIELAAGLLKLLIFVAFVVLALVVVLRPGIRIRMPALAPRPRPRHERWRPPLRAPPIFSRPSSCCAL